MNFLEGLNMREPVTLLQKEDKRKAALSIFNLSKMRLPSHSRQYKGFYLRDNGKGKLVPKDIWFDEEKLFQDAVCIALKDLKKIKLFFERPFVIVDPIFYYKRSKEENVVWSISP